MEIFAWYLLGKDSSDLGSGASSLITIVIGIAAYLKGKSLILTLSDRLLELLLFYVFLVFIIVRFSYKYRKRTPLLFITRLLMRATIYPLSVVLGILVVDKIGFTPLSLIVDFLANLNVSGIFTIPIALIGVPLYLLDFKFKISFFKFLESVIVSGYETKY